MEKNPGDMQGWEKWIRGGRGESALSATGADDAEAVGGTGPCDFQPAENNPGAAGIHSETAGTTTGTHLRVSESWPQYF